MSIPASFPYYDISRQPIPLAGELTTRLSVSTRHIAGRNQEALRRAVGGVAAIHGGRARKGDDGSSISDATFLSPPPPFSTGSGLGAMPSPEDVAALALPVVGDQQLAGVTGAAGVVAMESGGTGGRDRRRVGPDAARWLPPQRSPHNHLF